MKCVIYMPTSMKFCTHKIVSLQVRKVHSLLKTFTGPSEVGSRGVVCPNPEIGIFVNLISIRGKDYAHHIDYIILPFPPDFQTVLRPCN